MDKIGVIYRACGSECDKPKPFRPSWFSKQKCWDSFINEFDTPDYDIHVIWDGPRNALSETMESANVKIDYMNYQNNQKSLLGCYVLADNLTHCDGLYFVEDDYIHRYGAGRVFKEGLNRFKFITLYDHPDRYTAAHTDITYNQEAIFLGEKSYWRTVESTTCTVGISKPLFNMLKDDLFRFCEKGVGAPEDRAFYRHVIMNRGLRLFGAMPGYSTHCVQGLLSPLVDWDKVVSYL